MPMATRPGPGSPGVPGKGGAYRPGQQGFNLDANRGMGAPRAIDVIKEDPNMPDTDILVGIHTKNSVKNILYYRNIITGITGTYSLRCGIYYQYIVF